MPQGTKNTESDPHVNGMGNYEGDMILTPYQLQRMQGQSKSLHTGVTYWPSNGTHVNIPYKISSSTFNSFQRANIARAVEDYATHTCIR